ncbi:hypothetical protein [Streptomyces sp. NPDC088766]|uniref:hypothetical protein n=1 Tax=Streptomyces sp. NPDC088766 TaxID=3365893 RepID=UPI00382660CA
MDRRLLFVRWRAALADTGPPLVVLCLLLVWRDGFSWRNAADSLVVVPGAAALAALLALFIAAGEHVDLVRRARGTGLPVTWAALEDAQTVNLPVAWRPEDRDRFRAALLAAGRTSGVTETAGELRFEWRPLHSWRSVHATVSGDEDTGEVRVDIRGGGEQRGRDRGKPGRNGYRLPVGSSFVALCQLVRLIRTLPPPGQGAVSGQ